MGSISILVNWGGSVDTTKGLIAYYPFDGNANDYSGNNLNGTAMNNYSYGNGVVNQCINFVGVNSVYDHSGGYVSIPSITNFNLQSLTICLWVKEDTVYHSDGGEGYIVFSSDMRLGWCGIWHLNNTIQFAVGANNDDNNPNAINPISIPYDSTDAHKWVFYSMVYNDGYLFVYKNSVKLAGIKQKLNIYGNLGFIASHTWGGGRLSRAIYEI